MNNCEHEDYDDYFEKCNDCGADRVTVIADEFKNEIQAVYGKMQEVLGIDSGDIAPEQLDALTEAENTLADVVSKWLNSAMDRE